ncbi:MAG: penicillin-binding transpeptidase domain-containing protein, partial [Gammaproteobacteria bacterium]|nr:penicillin-binding transpeptidase domain-containing protein [Gammaproteobacteria bacterium]
GKDIKLSIDKRLQYIAYRDLKKAVQQHGAKSGSLVILDVNTGEVLAMVNEPAYNPNNYQDYSKSDLRNKAITDLYEPGSAIKPFIVATALKTQQFSADTPVKTSPGYMRVGRATIRDVHDYGELDITGVIRKSSNVGISKIALALPRELLWESLSDMGFGELSKSQFPGEANGYLPFFGEWKDLTQATVSFGYGISVTSLQLAQSYAVLANGGYLRPVSMISRDGAPEGKRVISGDISRAVMAMMETVVSREGTAVLAKIPGYRIAGKTGTVKKLAPNGGYLDDKYLSVFAGVAPVSKPRFAAVVMIDDPSNGDYYGGKVAAPVFSSVIGEALRIMNVAPDDLPEDVLRIATLDRGE